MALQPVNPQTHPTRLVQYMEALRANLHRQAKVIREETDGEKALTHLEDLAHEVENLASVVHSLAGHIAR